MNHPTLTLWRRHACWPLALFVAAALLFATTSVDLEIADALFFDRVSHHWRGAGNWWINDVIHAGGRWGIRAVVLLAFATWSVAHFKPSVRDMRRPLGFFLVAVVLTVGIVGLLKVITDVACPWDLQYFGGHLPYVKLFAPRLVGSDAEHCFPAAHASSGYALMALYFVAYERGRRLATVGLSVGLLTGLVFGFAQQARGAHFFSHDVWSAFLAWMIPLTLYSFVFRGRLHSAHTTE